MSGCAGAVRLCRRGPRLGARTAGRGAQQCGRGGVVDDWDSNFHGVVNGTRAFLPILAAQDCGAIVNTSSVFGLVGMPNQRADCAAKFAVRGFTDSLRQELRGTGVRAGGINTNIVRNARFRKDPEGRGRSMTRWSRNSPRSP